MHAIAARTSKIPVVLNFETKHIIACNTDNLNVKYDKILSCHWGIRFPYAEIESIEVYEKCDQYLYDIPTISRILVEAAILERILLYGGFIVERSDLRGVSSST